MGIALVLCAAFVPMAFFSGSTGVIYRQFSLTIASAVALSVLVALILTPALCATLLKPAPKDGPVKKRGFFGWFNRAFDRTADRYASGVGGVLRRIFLPLVAYAGIAAVVVFLYARIPSGFLPEEDQGVLFAGAQLPAGATTEQAQAVLEKMEHHFLVEEKDSVEALFGVTGFSFAGTGQNQVFAFVKLKDWEARKSPGQKIGAIQGRAMGAFAQFKDAFVLAFAPPAVLDRWQRHGLRLPPAGQRQPGPRGAHGRAQPVARHARAKPRACRPASAWRGRAFHSRNARAARRSSCSTASRS